MIKKYLWILFLFILIPFSAADDPTYILSNSENWQDVYSSLLYANLQKLGSDFLTSTNHGTTILNGIKKDNMLQIITSKNNPYVFNYQDMIKSEGFENTEEKILKEVNTQLIEELPNIQNFIIVDKSYGYNSIAVAPYAIQKNSWVFLADKFNIAKIDSIISQRNVNEILIYGYVDNEVRDILEKYNPKTINMKDKFQDNIEIVKEYLKLNPTTQVLLTNGEFIEKELLMGTEPILFTGKENVPDQIRDYLKEESPLEIGVLIGNDLIGTATNIRRSTGINVIVKFARGARTQTQGIAAIEGLDMFAVPTPRMELAIDSIKYNKLNSQIELTYKSNSNIPIYFKGVLTINSKKVGDAQPIFITPNNYKTVIYNIETDSEDLEADIVTIYGETIYSLDRLLKTTEKISVIEVLDNCNIEIQEIKYNKQKKEFITTVRNKENINCWINLEIENLKIRYEEETIGTSTPSKIEGKKTKKISIEKELTDEDIAQNQIIKLIAHYGEKQNGLTKRTEKTFELKTEIFGIITYMMITIAMAIILLLFTIILIQKKKF